MTPRSNPVKTTLALALTLGALAPAAASARYELNPTVAPGKPSPPAPKVVRAPAPSGFDWGDAGIGAAAGLGLSMVAVGGSLVIAGKRRHRLDATPASGVNA